jgi:hypothetical protein
MSTPWKRKEIIGDCTLYLGDCMEVMPTLGKVDAKTKGTGNEQPAKRQRCSPEESGKRLGAAQSKDFGPVYQWGYVADGDGADVRGISAGLPTGDCKDGYHSQRSRQGWKNERKVHRRDAINGLSKDDIEGQMQQVWSNGNAGDPSQGPQSHQQRDREFGSTVQPLPHEPSQARMVAFSEGWAILTDPPYGIGMSGGNVGYKGFNNLARKEWDTETPDEIIEFIRLTGLPYIIWGGNYFELPPARCYLVWDKGASFKGRSYAESELALTNLDANARTFLFDPLAKGTYKGKQHPTQKPVALMEWCLEFLPEAQTILDPFMGSGTTLVACAKLGRSGIGIELDEDYFNIACERVEKAYQQTDLFVAPPENTDTKRNQINMFDDGDAA